MARGFATNQQINGVTAIGRNQSVFAMAGWMRRPTSASHQVFGFAENNTNTLYIWHFNDNYIYLGVGNGSNSFAHTYQGITGWNHFAFTFDGSQTGNSNRLKGYVNGSQIVLGFTGTIPPSTSNNVAIEQFRIGRGAYANAWSTGDFAELGMWQAVLTADEIASLAKGMTCDKIRPQSLVTYIPLVRDIQDLARGMTLTNTDSTVATHPRIYP